MKNHLVLMFILMFTVLLSGCGERDVYDVMRENNQKEFERRQSMTQEERDAEDLAIKQAEEKAEQERIAEQKKKDEQAQWELANTDLIHYQVNRYSENGKFIVEGKYTLSPASSTKLETHNLENRGFNKELDNKLLIVDSSFFGGSPPSGKFDIYHVVWKKGSRDEAVRVGLSHYNVSRGW